MESNIICSSCKTVLSISSQSCPSCSSTKKTIHFDLHEKVLIREQIKVKGKDVTKTGKKKEVLKFTDGHELSIKGEWVNKIQLVDALKDKYFEKITSEKGEVIRFCEEPLSQHKGRGSAKFKSK